MKRYYVYILQCNDKSYYTGVTSALEKRIWEHQEGLVKGCYTHGRRPLKLVFQTEFNHVRDALSAENQIKGWSRKKKEALIQGRFDDLPGLSRNQQP
ncbi:MAG: GIY-YIG nuclease family protein [Nitrospinota bacterium]|nr:GIY-YIG nuclease family protein [Nitrospinota bacterium]